MSQSLRHTQILDIARREGAVKVEDLAQHFGVTLQTIRRDLAEMDENGHLERVHGGAVLPSGTVNIGYEYRQSMNDEAKRAIAKACAAQVPGDCSLFLNIGTSTEAVARELLAHRSLMVVTNNMNVANILVRNPDCDITLTGGTLRRSDGGLVGPLTQDAVARFKFDIAVIGCSALDEDGDLLDFDFQEVGVSQTIIRQARRVFLVADHSKISRHAPAKIAPLSEVDVLITDLPLPEPLRAKCAEWGVEVIYAEA
ncbi:DeoR/GlpR family DNA-binding transcription regulator [Pseudoprimorskyibacter insulae]|uniref:Glycerol-3-phosphate regulon repressor n=1 Tax=Pseudoprimorskyibacter insulae TaxID=1695997 RepID=A0A2R8AU20_9RHOB|nr:DeoR/GlpR family DNA-binding transcription regulator [Pseudoprimorskyibacter insulae]SPF79551.1 Glycerol-3-phosphate regulon repressor [Pseudoprimorskyibacter insulae]